MEVFFGKRGSGKTTELIKKSASTGAVIVAINPKIVQGMAKAMGLEIPKPISYYEFVEPQGLQGIRLYTGLLVDNADNLLKYMAERKYCNVDGFSVGGTDDIVLRMLS